MAVKLHRCPNVWAKLSGHPCWKVQKALDDEGIAYEVVKGPLRRASATTSRRSAASAVPRDRVRGRRRLPRRVRRDGGHDPRRRALREGLTGAQDAGGSAASA